MNYVWSEVHGNLEASIFTSFYTDYLNSRAKPKLHENYYLE